MYCSYVEIVLATYVIYPKIEHLLSSLSHSQSQLISNAFISNVFNNMITTVPVVVPSPPVPVPIPSPPSSPSVKTTAPTTNTTCQRNGSQKEVRATGIQPGVLTQELVMPSLGTLDTLSVLDLIMSVGTPAAGARVKDTPRPPLAALLTGVARKR